MQNLEYINVSYDLTENELATVLKEIRTIPEIQTVVLPQYFIKYARGILGHDKNISCLVDFPMGMSDIKSRASMSSTAIKNLANYIDIVIPSNYLTNRKYDKIREDIKYQKEICKNVRYILEYRAYDHQYLKKMAEILVDNDLKTVCISTGQSVDVLSDALIASQFLISQVKDLNTIISANLWNNRHFDLIIKNNVSILRSSFIPTLELFIGYNNHHGVK
jgi:deoxyribose-phosphate aldolase